VTDPKPAPPLQERSARTTQIIRSARELVETDGPEALTMRRLGEVVGMPLAFSAMDPAVRRHAPALGEHTDEVLGEHGYSRDEITELRRRSVVA